MREFAAGPGSSKVRFKAARESMELDGRTALVTGAGRGIGEAIARRLAGAGARVVCAERRTEEAEAVAHVIGEAGGRAEAAGADLAEPAEIRVLAAAHDGVDILINNAGVGRTEPFLATTWQTWYETLAINLTAPFLLSQRLAPAMVAHGWGRIVNVASISGLLAGTGRTAYGASKGGLIQLTRQMAAELGRHGVTVNAIAPGPVDTAMTRAMHSGETRAAYNARNPLHRYGEAAEVAAAVAFLASAEASYVNGQTLAVDGGLTITSILAEGPE